MRRLVAHLLFTDPWRRWLLRLSLYLPAQWADVLWEALYPPDLRVRFIDEEVQSLGDAG